MCLRKRLRLNYDKFVLHQGLTMREQIKTLASSGFDADVHFRGLIHAAASYSSQVYSTPLQFGGGVPDARLALDAYTLYESATEQPKFVIGFCRALNAVVVVFRGTASFSDALVDAYVVGPAHRLAGIQCHHGMGDRLWHSYADIVAHMKVAIDAAHKLTGKDGLRVLITGHSLGGGYALILTAALRHLGEFTGENVVCITFAAPLVFFERTQAVADCASCILNVVNQNDVGPRMLYCDNDDDIRRRCLNALKLAASGHLPACVAVGCFHFVYPVGNNVYCRFAFDADDPQLAAGERLFQFAPIVFVGGSLDDHRITHYIDHIRTLDELD